MFYVLSSQGCYRLDTSFRFYINLCNVSIRVGSPSVSFYWYKLNILSNHKHSKQSILPGTVIIKEQLLVLTWLLCIRWEWSTSIRGVHQLWYSDRPGFESSYWTAENFGWCSVGSQQIRCRWKFGRVGCKMLFKTGDCQNEFLRISRNSPRMEGGKDALARIGSMHKDF